MGRSRLAWGSRALGLMLAATALFSSVPTLAEGAAGDGNGSRWIVGRTPDVFRRDRDVIATRIGGWIDASFQDNDIPGRSFSLNLNHVNVYLDTRWREWQLFVEAEYEHATALTGYSVEREFEVEQAYLLRSFGEAVELRAGRFNTSFGYWVPIHWAILMDTISDPLFIGREWIPEQQVGSELRLRFFPGRILGREASIDGALYLGLGEATVGEDTVEGVAYGGDLRVSLAEDFRAGVSAYRRRNGERDGRRETTVGLYAEAHPMAEVTVRGELLQQWRGRSAGHGTDRRVQALYGKVRWDLHDRIYLNYRFDLGDDEDGGGSFQQRIHTATLGIRPHPSVHLKLEYSVHRVRSSSRRNFAFWGASVGFLF